MAFNFLSFCNNESNPNEDNRNRRSLLLEKEKLISRLKHGLDEEQQRSEQLTETNQDLSEQISSLKDQISVYSSANDNQNETRYESAQLQQLLKEKEMECLAKDDIISQLKEEQMTDQQRNNGLQDLLETKSLDIMHLKEEIEGLKQNSPKTPNTRVKSFPLPLDYVKQHFSDYKTDHTSLLNIWNKVDSDNNEQISVSEQNMTVIFTEFIDLISIKYINDNKDLKSFLNITNEKQIISHLQTDFIVKNAQIMRKEEFLNDFIARITDSESQTWEDSKEGNIAIVTETKDNISTFEAKNEERSESKNEEIITLEKEANNVVLKEETKENNTKPKPKAVTTRKASDALIKHNPSIVYNSKIDSNFSAKDANQILKWLKQSDTKQLKESLANLLSSRNAVQRGQILDKYPNIFSEISSKIKKGHVLYLCEIMIQSNIAAAKAYIINKAHNENEMNIIGDVLCTSNNAEIREIILEYKALYLDADLVKKISDLCDKNKRGSVRIILDSLLRCKRDEQTIDKINIKSVENDVNFLVETKKFKTEQKRRLVEIFCNNNWKYIRAINREYGKRSVKVNLEKLIRSSLGGGSAHFSVLLLKYSLSPTEYFAQRLVELGAKFDKNKEEIGRIFVLRSEIDLNDIRTRFGQKQFGSLEQWIDDKAKASKFGHFLKAILTSIDRYNKQGANKPKYNSSDLQMQILNNSDKRAQSLAIFVNGDTNVGFVQFLSKHSKSKIVEKMWLKLDSKNNGFIEMSKFPDLIALIVILHKVRAFQQKTKSKSKPDIDNRQIRGEVEHLAMWVGKRYIYNEKNEFKLTRDEFQNKLSEWCQQYIDAKGVFDV